jgi:hypothetical protein
MRGMRTLCHPPLSSQPRGRWLVGAALVAAMAQAPSVRAEEPAAGSQAPLGVAPVPLDSPAQPGSPPQQNEAEERAERLLQQAKARFAEGDYQASVSLLEEAYTLTHSPRFLMNLGVAHHYLNECETALGYYQQYLQADPQGGLHAEASAAIEQLEPICGQKAKPPVADLGPAPNTLPALVAPGPPAQTAAPAPFSPPTSVPEPAPSVSASQWLLIGAGAAAVGSLTMGLLAVHAKHERESLQQSVPPGQTWDEFAGKSRDAELQQNLHRDQVWCWVFAGSSVLLAGTAGALHLLDAGPKGSLAFAADGFPSLQYQRQF